MSKKLLNAALLAALSGLMVACSSTQEVVDDETIEWTAPQIYNAARESVRGGEWKKARAYLSAIETRFPYSSYAQQSLIDQAYVDFKDDEPEKATAAIDRFLQMYPGHPGVEYMLYLKGLITFTPPSAFLNSYTGQDPSERDPKGLRQSYAAFSELVKRFPDGKYARDAKLRLSWLVSTIAQNEVNVAEYYYRRGAYVAAINRAQAVIRDFTGVTAAERALYIMMLSYDALHKPEQASDARRVLLQNFPNTEYLEGGLDKDKSWIDHFSPKGWFTN
ncbi:outer membrane protein assembly factor BamD [Brackiella oedipodis]|uniref:outer membrane protein assembly factor BamD n=1 Tax=Brackiella oedipodis TaxID=124225 RepID=UPI00056F8152|nr:outer membrane protein assembly factor BamD [Brackiella oedipodis]